MSEANSTTPQEGKQAGGGVNEIERAEVDPGVSCPVVFGEHMRASGFFFETSDETYLVTARHNALPTNAEQLETGGVSLDYEVDHVFPEVDVYLRTGDEVTVERLDIRDVDGVKQTPDIDLLGIPVDFDPESYGYQIWRDCDIVSPANATETLDIIGFDGASFPDSGRYDVSTYCSAIRRPAILGIVNEMRGTDNLSRFGSIAVGADKDFVGEGSAYRGLSGAPVLGRGLTGVHILNWSVPQKAIAMTGGDEFEMMVFVRATVLPELLK